MIHAAGTAARWRRTTAILLAGALAAAAAVLGTASAASADTGYSLSGTVTDTGSAPLSGIQVTATTNLGSAIETTDANGEYTFPHLQAGEYTIRFDGGSDYVTQYYAEAADAASATSMPRRSCSSSTICRS